MKAIRHFIVGLLAWANSFRKVEPIQPAPCHDGYHTEIEDYLNPYAFQNGERYKNYAGHCMTVGCDRVPGTAWSPYWCQPCNATRMERIRRNFNNAANQLTVEGNA